MVSIDNKSSSFTMYIEMKLPDLMFIMLSCNYEEMNDE